MEMNRIVGAMSGTSCDGLDLVYCEFEGYGTHTKATPQYFEWIPYPDEIQKWLLHMTSGEVSVGEVCQGHAFLGALFGKMIREYMERNSLVDRVDLIVSHGQTIYHIPESGKEFHETSSTLQIGDGDRISVITGKQVLSDLRAKDMAVGGQGAPLVVYTDYALFSVPKKNIVMLNLGGIANLTLLPASQDFQQVMAFDTGPSNVLIDWGMRAFFNQLYDHQGDCARSGAHNDELFQFLIELEKPYASQKPPKSTGKEVRYNETYLSRIFQWMLEHETPPQDLIRTLTDFTIHSVIDAIHSYLPPIDGMLIAGGGGLNPMLVEGIQKLLPEVDVSVMDEMWIKAKEAIAFSLMGNEYLHHRSANVPSATGASRPVVLGKLSLPD
jgi:anhydro-N-acetylmuramic acid kinase